MARKFWEIPIDEEAAAVAGRLARAENAYIKKFGRDLDTWDWPGTEKELAEAIEECITTGLSFERLRYVRRL